MPGVYKNPVRYAYLFRSWYIPPWSQSCLWKFSRSSRGRISLGILAYGDILISIRYHKAACFPSHMNHPFASGTTALSISVHLANLSLSSCRSLPHGTALLQKCNSILQRRCFAGLGSGLWKIINADVKDSLVFILICAMTEKEPSLIVMRQCHFSTTVFASYVCCQMFFSS